MLILLNIGGDNLDCENVQIVINQSNELYGTLLYHQGRFTLVTLPDLDLAQKSKTALKAMFREGLSDTIELAAKGAMKAIASAIAKKCGVRVPPNALPMNFGEYYETIKYYYRNNTYDYACVLWELPFPMMISLSWPPTAGDGSVGALWQVPIPFSQSSLYK